MSGQGRQGRWEVEGGEWMMNCCCGGGGCLWVLGDMPISMCEPIEHSQAWEKQLGSPTHHQGSREHACRQCARWAGRGGRDRYERPHHHILVLHIGARHLALQRLPCTVGLHLQEALHLGRDGAWRGMAGLGDSSDSCPPFQKTRRAQVIHLSSELTGCLPSEHSRSAQEAQP